MRVRAWLLSFVIGFGALSLLDFVLIEFVVGDGLAGLSDQERAAAAALLGDVSVTCLDNPIAYGLTRQLRVVEIRFVPGCKRPRFADGVGGDYRVSVQAYTFFGIPSVRISECCANSTSGDIHCWWPGDEQFSDPCPPIEQSPCEQSSPVWVRIPSAADFGQIGLRSDIIA